MWDSIIKIAGGLVQIGTSVVAMVAGNKQSQKDAVKAAQGSKPGAALDEAELDYDRRRRMRLVRKGD